MAAIVFQSVSEFISIFLLKAKLPGSLARAIAAAVILLTPSARLDAQATWDTFADTWAATDALGRTLPTPAVTGPPRADKKIAMFYYLWNGSHTTGLYDISKIISQDPDAIHEFDNPLWGPRNSFHFWGEPQFGYYRMQDAWVIRRHAQMLTDAGVDAVFFDVTNSITYKPVYDLVMDTYADMRAHGQDTPQIAFLTWTNSGTTAQTLYNDIYLPGRHSDLWFRWNGKPIILAKPEELAQPLLDFFTVRKSWAWQPGEDKWSWIENEPQQGGWSGSPGNLEQVSVATASHPSWNSTSNGKSFHLTAQPANEQRNTALGIKFANQWRRALELDPELVFVTQWNEWTAQRFQNTKTVNSIYAKRTLYPNDPYFVDAYDDEFNRDIEPMKGGYGDNYYYQLVDNVRRFKGARAVAEASAPVTINLGDFATWEGVGPEFRDDADDVRHRSHAGFGSQFYTNTTGRNDFKRALAARDETKLYLYVEAVAPLTDKSAADAGWMNCFLRDETSSAPAWEGYHFRLSNENPSSANLTLSRCTGAWNWTALGEIATHRDCTRMAISIPRSLLGLASPSTFANLSFKWTDNQQGTTAESWLLNGDAAPNARFRYPFRAVGAHTATPSNGSSYRLIHRETQQVATPKVSAPSAGGALELAIGSPAPAQKWTLIDAGSGRWTIFNTQASIINGPADPLVIEVPGGVVSDRVPLSLGTWVQADYQSWSLAPAGDGWFRLVNAATGMALTTTATGALVQSNAADCTAQHWSLEPVSPVEAGARYRFSNRNSGMLAVPNQRNMNSGDAVVQQLPTGQWYEPWIAYPQSPERIQFVSEESRRPLQSAPGAGAPVVQGDVSADAVRQWDVRLSAPGYFQFLSPDSGQAVGVMNGAAAGGTPLVLYSASPPVTATQWRFASVVSPAGHQWWDPAVSGGSALGGDGQWDPASPSWWNSVANAPWPADPTSANPHFGGISGAVAIPNAGVTAGQLSFHTGGYSLSGGPVNLTGAGAVVSIGSGMAATLNAPIIRNPSATTDSLRFEGSGTFTLAGGGTLNRIVDFRDGVRRLTGGVFTSTGIASGSSGLLLSAGATLEIDGASLNRVNSSADDALYVVGSGQLKLRSGSMDVSGGRGLVIGFGALSSGTTTLDGGSLTTSAIVVGWNTNASLAVNGGILTANVVQHQDAGNGTFHLIGGTVLTKQLFNNSSNGTFTARFNGGILKARENQENFIYKSGSSPFTLKLENGGAVIDSNSFNVTVKLPFTTDPGSTGGLTKLGAGELVLDNTANSYSGETLVKGGTLTLRGNSAAIGTGAARVASGASLRLQDRAASGDLANALFLASSPGPATLDLNGNNSTVGALYFGAVRQAAGTWGSTGSGAANVNDIHFTGPGILTVSNGPGDDPYTVWTIAKGLTGPTAAFDADPDSDGQPNGIEFVLGGEPNPDHPDANSTSLLPIAQARGDNLVFTYKLSDASVELHPVVEFDDDLIGPWTTAQAGSNAEIQITDGTPADTVEVSIPRTGSTRLFVRLKVSQRAPVLR